MARVHKITPCLWFNCEAEEAAKFYVSIFPNSRVVHTTRYGKAGQEVHGRPEGSVMTVQFELDGQAFTALNGGPIFQFNEAISLQILCETQDEIDYYWDKLTAGGQKSRCGWLKDRYGLSWQVTPTLLTELLNDPDPEKVTRVTQAFMPMGKFDIAGLRRAYRGA